MRAPYAGSVPGSSLAVPRRTALMLAIAAAAGACSGPHEPERHPERPAGTPTPSRSAAPSPTATAPTPSLPAVTHWRPGAGELEPAAKAAAVRTIERLGNRANHRVQVVDAQYGGLLTSTASVLVVSRSVTRRRGRLVEGGYTFDVRLALRGGRWRVTAVHPSRPGRPTAHPSSAARHVLADRRITLPAAAHADVASGLVHDSVLEAMLAVSRRWPIGVSVIRSGHPIFVFGTDRRSDHPRGRAFDTWRIAGHPVVRPATPRALITEYMEALAAVGSYNVGGPILLGVAPQYFSDRTHHDHVHAGFST
jgi:hypothetical protein